MFYNALIQAFLPDESLFTDVKAIVDCPLKVDPSEVIKACREKKPRDILEFLDAPGSDLEHPPLTIPVNCLHGRNGFLLEFDQRKVINRVIQRRATVTTSSTKNKLIPGHRSPQKSSIMSLSGRLRPSLTTEITGPEMELLHLASTRARPVDTRKNVRRGTAHTGLATFVDDFVEDYMENPEDSALIISNVTKQAVLQKYFLRVKRLGEELIQTWPKFYRRTSPNWAPDRNSLIPVPRGFIVPGGRFIEIYYWDSYWIIRGLLSSGLDDIAQGIIENFLFCIERYGFIPNGLRKYYLDRSQPPMLSNMLRAYYHYTGDKDFIQSCLQLLEREYEFWMSDRHGHAVELEIPDRLNPGKTKPVTLNRYYSLEVSPRPESYRIDQITGKLYEEFKGAAESLQEHFRAIRAAAESGWDFSSRWLRPAVEGLGESGIKPDQRINKVLHKVCLVDIDTCHILPCDLNGFLFCLEEDLAFFANILGKSDSEQIYLEARERRREGMLYLMWDPHREMWLDYDMKTKRLSCVISAASFVPLWAGVNPEIMADDRRIELASKLSCIVRPYGVVATNISAGLQWDNPNVWAPNHHMAVDFLCGGRFWEIRKKAAEDDGPAMALGINWASRFVNTVLDRFEFFGTCSEKYDCNRLGKSGVDGEYVTQDGFGWTNGTVLDFMEKFGIRLTPQGLYSSKRPGESFSNLREMF